MNQYSILIIDDLSADRYILRRMLNQTGLVGEIFEADNALRAIEFLRNHDKNRQCHADAFPPKFIFVDINMPVADGFDFLKWFRELVENGSFSSSIVLMYSSSQHPEDMERVFAYDFVKDFVVKIPDTAQDLKSQMLTALE